MKQVRNVAMDGAAIVLRLDPDQRYAVCRDLWFDEDIDKSWFVGVVRPETPEIDGDRKGGGIRVNDPAVTGFLRELFCLLADPDHFGDRTCRRRTIAGEAGRLSPLHPGIERERREKRRETRWLTQCTACS